ncbi:hypothetical protein GCM10027269_84790 [Kribbella endophytica]
MAQIASKCRGRALVVGEVFDAKDLDIAIIEFAVEAGAAVTLVGNPWQTLYVFRDGRPEVVPLLLDRQEFRRLSLTESFRWRDPGQSQLADTLRAGQSATLPVLNHAAGPWEPTWSCPPIGSRCGNSVRRSSRWRSRVSRGTKKRPRRCC